MNSKVLITLCLVALFSAQGISARRIDVEEIRVRGIVDDLVKKINGLVDNLKDTIKNTIQEKLQALQNTVDDILGVKDKILEQGKQLIGDQINGDLKEIADAEAEANKQGVSVKECVFGKIEEIKDVGVAGVSNLVGCVTARVDEALAIVNNAMKIVTDSYDTIVAIPAKVKSCSSSFSAFACMPKIFVEVSGLAVSIPTQVTATATEAVTFYNGLGAKLSLCSSAEALKVSSKAAIITADTLRCITSKVLAKDDK